MNTKQKQYKQDSLSCK